MLQTATQNDKAVLAALIFSSGENNLNFLFSQQALAYLEFALDAKEGQFGYSNQHIIRQGKQIVACGSCWTNNIPQQYHEATLKSLISFFGTEKPLSILQKSAVLAKLLSPPKEHELGVGHFAVASNYGRRGLGTALLDYYVERAKQLQKNFLVLDVEANNQPALNFYYKYGFELSDTKVPDENVAALNLNTHLHLRFAI